jgi:cell division protein FtsB
MALKSLYQAARHWLRGDHPKVARRRLLAAVSAAALAWFILGGQQGLFALAMGQREKASLREQITELAADNARLRAQADALERNPEACEKTAREQLQLMRPGEIIYRFQ